MTLTRPPYESMAGHHWTRTAANGQDVNARPSDWPSMGSVVEYLSRQQSGSERRGLPDYIYLPNRLGALQGYDRTGQDAGWLGSAYNALHTNIKKRDAGDNPYFRPCTDDELDFRVGGFAEVEVNRLDRRKSLLTQFDDSRRRLDKSDACRNFDLIQQRAMSLVTSDSMRDAFDVRRESAKTRDKYGRHLFGQSVLMGRRMVEAGARFVTVAWDTVDGYSWDSLRSSQHLKQHLLPGFDQTFAALISDLEQRGLLDETLVVAVGEMGRTPKPNSTWGRGHWSHCFPCVLAGAGVKQGLVYGCSDDQAAYPDQSPVTPEDLAKTIYWSLGINPELMLHDPLGRPVPIIESGAPLKQLFS